MDDATRKVAAIAAGTMSLIAGQPALALPAVQDELFTVGIVGTNSHDFANVELLYKEQQVGGSFGGTTFLKFEDKWSTSNSMSFVGPGDAALGKSFMVIGEYLNAAGGVGGLFVDMNVQAANSAIDKQLKFDGIFPNSTINLGDFSSLELKIENALQLGDTAVLDSLYKESFAVPNGTAFSLDGRTVGSLVEFSSATAGGTITVSQQPIPEPATFWTMLGGLLALVGLRSSRVKQRPTDSLAEQRRR